MPFLVFCLLGIVFNFYLLFLAAQGLRYCLWVFSGCGKWGLLSSCSAQASHCGSFFCGRARVLRCESFSSCGVQAQLPHSMWDLLVLVIEPMSPSLAGRFLTTEPPGQYPGAISVLCLLACPSSYLPACLFLVPQALIYTCTYNADQITHIRDPNLFPSHYKLGFPQPINLYITLSGRGN